MLLGLAVLAIGALWQTSGSRQIQDSSAGEIVALIGETAPPPIAPSVAATPLPGHATAPDPNLLAGDAARQAIYDAGARPGEFVTPPNVSIAH